LVFFSSEEGGEKARELNGEDNSFNVNQVFSNACHTETTLHKLWSFGRRRRESESSFWVKVKVRAAL
jgi:hypothetical protein